MSVLAVIGAVTVGLIALSAALILLAMAWAYIQAAGGLWRAYTVAERYGVKLHKGETKPAFFDIRMIHWQAWHMRDWCISGLIVPWTFRAPIRRERLRYLG